MVYRTFDTAVFISPDLRPSASTSGIATRYPPLPLHNAQWDNNLEQRRPHQEQHDAYFTQTMQFEHLYIVLEGHRKLVKVGNVIVKSHETHYSFIFP